MLLVESGKLALNETIDQYLPEEYSNLIPNSSMATIAHLLSNSSGIPDFLSDQNFIFDRILDQNHADYYSFRLFSRLGL